jgi:zinc transport system ATP-binding protein
MAIQSVIDVKDLTVSYGGGESVLEGMTFTVSQGSVFAIIGPNGSGKTTLLRTLLGTLAPDGGTVHVLGDSPARVRGRVGYVPQRFIFDRTFPITVEEFLMFSHPRVTAAKLNEYLDHLDMCAYRRALLGTLSGGQLQRVLVVRAILHDPEILYLDEPVSGIDVVGERTFYNLIGHLRDEHKITIIMVSHEIDFVSSFADELICVNKKLLCRGKPEKALTPAVIEELFGRHTRVYRHTGHRHGANQHHDHE